MTLMIVDFRVLWSFEISRATDGKAHSASRAQCWEGQDTEAVLPFEQRHLPAHSKASPPFKV